jgi:putative transposase
MTSDIVIKALLMAIWRRTNVTQVIIHSDQRSQYARGDYRDFL